MSFFNTHIPTKVKEVLETLPPGSFVHAVTYIPAQHQILVMWETDTVKTPYSTPVEYSPEDLKCGRKPKESMALDIKPLPAPLEIQKAKTVPAPTLPAYLNEKQVTQAIANREPLLYMGVTHAWSSVPPNHKFIPGYFYRRVIPSKSDTLDALKKEV